MEIFEENPITQQIFKELMEVLKLRFEKNIKRHPQINWANVERKLIAQPDKLKSLLMMENSGGEPDVTGYDALTGEYIFIDCSKESPAGRRSLCYDKEALNKRKENKPVSSACSMAEEMGVEILTAEEYRELQENEHFDTKTSSWLKTPPDIRKLGGAIFGDFRYGQVFIYHNSAESYYAARGFRSILRV